MNEKHEHLWHAYVDGELSVTEMAEFEKSLKSTDRERLAGEMRFENGLADRLSENAACPKAVWDRTLSLLQEAQEKEAAPDNVVPMRRHEEESSRRPWFWGAASMVAAATVAFAILYTPGSVMDKESPVVILAAESVDDLAAESEVDGGIDAMNKYLADHGVDLGLNGADSLNMSKVHYGIDILGAKEEMLGGTPVLEMLFSCCDAPVKVVMTKQNSEAARYIGAAVSRGSSEVQATRVIHGGYLVAVVGRHPAHGLLDIFSGQHP